MEQILVHSGAFYILIPFLEIYSLKSFKFKFLNRIRIKIIGYQGFFTYSRGLGAQPQKPEANKFSGFELS